MNKYTSGKNSYLFIDGGCLESILLNFSINLFSGREIEIDYRKLSADYQKVFYYDCLPSRKKQEDEEAYQARIQPKQELFNKLRSLKGFHVYEGTARLRDKRRGQEQKEVDIMIAVDMLSHSFRRNMTEATLLTSDLDFKPLLDALVQDGMYVSLMYPKGKANYELVDAADAKYAIDISQLKLWFTDSFNSSVKLPTTSQVKVISLDASWEQVDSFKEASYTAFLYQKGNSYAATIPRENNIHDLLQHDDVEQLKFYIKHVYSANVFRQV